MSGLKSYHRIIIFWQIPCVPCSFHWAERAMENEIKGQKQQIIVQLLNQK